MNPKSIIFLLILMCVVLFVVGINLGKTIEKIDKNYIKPTSIPKNISPAPTSSPISYLSFSKTNCGVTFIYPSNFKENMASLSASLVQDMNLIKFSCDKKDIDAFNDKLDSLSKEKDASFNGKKILTYKVNDHTLFTLQNPITGKVILFETSNNFLPLLLRSLEFTAAPTPTLAI